MTQNTSPPDLASPAPELCADCGTPVVLAGERLRHVEILHNHEPILDPDQAERLRVAALAGTGLVVPSGQTAEPSPLAALAASYPVAQARADLAAYAEHMAVPVASLDDAAQRAHKLRDAEVVGCVVGSLAGLLSAIDREAGAS